MAETLSSFLGQWSGIAYVFMIVLAVLVISAILHPVLRRLTDNTHSAKHVWRDALLGSASAPLQGLIWIIGLSVAVTILTQGGKASLLAAVFPPARNIAAIAVAAWFLLRVVGRSQLNLQHRARRQGQELDRTAADAIGKLLRAAIVITAVLVMMQTLGFSIAGILAFGGMGGIAVGFAAQSLVANLLGGLTVYASRIFKIGEDIILPGTDLAGTVQHIGWRATRVLGWDGKPFYVPNSYFNASNMVNHSRLEHRSFSENILLRYQDFDKVRAIVHEGNEVLAERDDLAYFVFRFDSFGDAALKLNIYAWPQTVPAGDFLPYAEFARIKEEVLLSIVGIARDHGCELILPVSHLYLREGWQSTLSEPLAGAETGHVLPAQAAPGAGEKGSG